MKKHTHIPSLTEHYSQLLGLTNPWVVASINLDVSKATLDIHVVEENSSSFSCPECGASASLHDHAPERRWRHLDTMQFTTEIVTSLPRVSCAEHGVKTITVPWADPHAHWTLLFEQFAIEVLRGTSNITRAMTLLKIGWKSAYTIQKRAVERGIARRTDESISHVGIDEKSFLKGHHYASLATDLDQGRVLDVVEGRKKEAAIELLGKAISEKQRDEVKAGAMDMWQPFMTAWKEVFGHDTPLVHDKFHIAGYLGKAVDNVRKSEHKLLKRDGSDTLTKTKYLWLKNPDTWEKEERQRFDLIMKDELKVGRAWALKETFKAFWEYKREWSARRFFDRWYFRATHSRLKPIIKVAKTLKRHLEGLLTYMEHPITNAVTEGLNSKIQLVKASARGFRNFENYRISILFHCGKLEMYPLKS